MKFTLKDPIYVCNKWYDRDGKETISNSKALEYPEDDRKKAGYINNLFMSGLCAVLIAVSAAAYLIG